MNGQRAGSTGRTDLVVLAGLLAVAMLGCLFLVIANRVTAGGTRTFDERVLMSLRTPGDPADPLGPRWLHEVARDVTAMGGYAVLGIMVGSLAGFLLINRHYPAALLVIGTTLSGLALSHFLKGFYDRPRPDLVPHLTHVSTSSFPSGHAMLSAVVYLTLGALLTRLADGWRTKMFALAVAVLLVILIGFSRVYLGVHYPTDVAAGWAAGLAWALLCWLVARYLQRHGVVEGDRG